MSVYIYILMCIYIYVHKYIYIYNYLYIYMYDYDYVCNYIYIIIYNCFTCHQTNPRKSIQVCRTAWSLIFHVMYNEGPIAYERDLSA